MASSLAGLIAVAIVMVSCARAADAQGTEPSDGVDLCAMPLPALQIEKRLEPIVREICRRSLTFQRQLMERVGRGDVAAVAATLDAHPEWLAAQGQNERLWTGGFNALAVATLSGHTAVVQLLLARGAHLAAPAAAGVSPIALAAIEGRTNVVGVLLSGGVTVDLFAAAAIGDAQRVATFVRSDPALVRERTFDGKTPLHFCRGVEVAQVLLTAGADIDALDDSGQTPLQWISATGRHKSVCRYLIAQGAKAEASDIFWACSYGDVPVILRFLEGDASLVHARRPVGPGIHTSWVGRTPLHDAAVRGEAEIGRLLIERSADVNARGGTPDATPLHVAAVCGHRELVDLLLEANADRSGVLWPFGACCVSEKSSRVIGA
jgi:ankyrin repeat protein